MFWHLAGWLLTTRKAFNRLVVKSYTWVTTMLLYSRNLGLLMLISPLPGMLICCYEVTLWWVTVVPENLLVFFGEEDSCS